MSESRGGRNRGGGRGVGRGDHVRGRGQDGAHRGQYGPPRAGTPPFRGAPSRGFAQPSSQGRPPLAGSRGTWGSNTRGVTHATPMATDMESTPVGVPRPSPVSPWNNSAQGSSHVAPTNSGMEFPPPRSFMPSSSDAPGNNSAQGSSHVAPINSGMEFPPPRSFMSSSSNAPGNNSASAGLSPASTRTTSPMPQPRSSVTEVVKVPGPVENQCPDISSLSLTTPPPAAETKAPQEATPGASKNRRKKKKTPKTNAPEGDQKETSDPVETTELEQGSPVKSESSSSTTAPLVPTPNEATDTTSNTATTTTPTTGMKSAISPPNSSKKVANQRKRQAISNSDMKMEMVHATIDKVIELPPRPDGGGKMGQMIDLTTNWFDVKIENRKVLCYRVEDERVDRLSAEGEKREVRMSPRDRRGLLKNVVPTLPAYSVYDGGNIVYTLAVIPNVPADGMTRQLEIRESPKSDMLILTYRIMSVGETNTVDVVNYVKNIRSSSTNLPQESIRVLDCVFKMAFQTQGYEGLGRNSVFEAKTAQDIRDKMFSINRGFFTSVRPQWQIRLNVDTTYKAFLTSGNLADVMYDKHGDRMTDLSPMNIRRMEMDIKKIRLKTAPLYEEKTGHRRKFTMFGISTQPAKSLNIADLDQTVEFYFKDKHKLQLKYPELPCIKVNQHRDAYIPMELLEILPFQSPSNVSKADIAAAVIKKAAIRPGDRFKEIEIFARDMLQRRPPVLQKYGIELSSQFTKLKGRVLPTPSAEFRGAPVSLTRGKWNVNGFHTLGGQNRQLKWAAIAVPPSRTSMNCLQGLVSGLGAAARDKGMNLLHVESTTIQPASIVPKLGDLTKKGVDLVVLLLHDDFNYAEIKRCSDLYLGIRTQCIRERTLGKPAVFPNLLLKINGKLGGVNWTIPDIVRSKPSERFMVFGADVTHPAPTQAHELRYSVAAVTGSYTKDLMRCAAVVRQQATTRRGDRTVREIIDELGPCIEELITHYGRQCNGELPTKLMFYRDGVSDGQFTSVLIEELTAIQHACGRIRQNYQPGITYIVVQKRHHTRFKPDRPDPSQRSGNIPPGTVIDTVITHPREFDFYLNSAEGIQGTSKPAHYYVLYDDSHWSSDALQLFTYYLCHAYMRCSRSVSYPAPTYYAHLAAFRAREWLNGVERQQDLLKDQQFMVHTSQKTGMFYL